MARLRSYGAVVNQIGPSMPRPARLPRSARLRPAPSSCRLTRTRWCSPAPEASRWNSAEQAKFDTLLIAVGGGGLIAGCAAAIGAGTKIVAVETEGTPTLHEALKAGRPVDVEISGIAADALGASRIGTPNFELARTLVRDSVLVTDDAVRAAQRALWDELRIVAEPPALPVSPRCAPAPIAPRRANASPR